MAKRSMFVGMDVHKESIHISLAEEGIARSNGLSYWPSVAYTFAGSAMWEIAG